MEEIKIGHVYRHYKGKDYEVISLARDCEDSSKIYVVYRQKYSSNEFPVGKTWIRTLGDFLGFKEIDGNKVKRFTLIK